MRIEPLCLEASAAESQSGRQQSFRGKIELHSAASRCSRAVRALSSSIRQEEPTRTIAIIAASLQVSPTTSFRTGPRRGDQFIRRVA
jgi:hypothetical protein